MRSFMNMMLEEISADSEFKINELADKYEAEYTKVDNRFEIDTSNIDTDDMKAFMDDLKVILKKTKLKYEILDKVCIISER